MLLGLYFLFFIVATMEPESVFLGQHTYNSFANK